MAQPASVTLVAIIAIVALAPIYVVVHAITDPLRRLPGPFLARFSRLWYFREVYGGAFEKHSLQLHEKFGELQCKPTSICTAAKQFLRPYCAHCSERV